MPAKKEELLQKEAERQNKVIDVLLKANHELEETLHACEHWWQDIISVAHANPGFAEAFGKAIHPSAHSILHSSELFLPIIRKIYGSPEKSCSSANLMMGKPEAGLPSANLMVGKPEAGLPSVNLMIGKPEAGLSYVNLMIGKDDTGMPSADLMAGKNGATGTIGQKTDGATIEGHCHYKTTAESGNLSPQPGKATDADAESSVRHNQSAGDAAVTGTATATKTGSTFFPVSLEDLIARVIIRSNRQGLESAADILKRLEQSPKQSMKQLQSLTGLTQSGMGKRLMSLKRHGLIRRGPNRQLLLTDKAKELLDKARNK